jgi:hypothetical protein
MLNAFMIALILPVETEAGMQLFGWQQASTTPHLSRMAV